MRTIEASDLMVTMLGEGALHIGDATADGQTVLRVDPPGDAEGARRLLSACHAFLGALRASGVALDQMGMRELMRLGRQTCEWDYPYRAPGPLGASGRRPASSPRTLP